MFICGFLKKPFGQPCKSYRLPKLKEYQNNYGISSVEHNGFFRADLLAETLSVFFPSSNICEQVSHWRKWRTNNYVQTWVGTGASTRTSTNTSQFWQVGYFWPSPSGFSPTVCWAWEKGNPLAGVSAAASKGTDFLLAERIPWTYWLSEHRTSDQQFIKSNCVFPRSSQTFGACYKTLQDPTSVLLLLRKSSPTSPDYEPQLSHGSHCLECSLDT